MIKAYQAYGFLMALKLGSCSDSNFEKVLQRTEAFIMRRHICRERANENETVFARLCAVDCSNPLPEVREEFLLYCPSDDVFREAFSKFFFAANLIERARYCLIQFENQLQGRHLELLVGGPDLVEVEHIIPQKIKSKRARDEYGDWPNYLGAGSETAHSRYVGRIGNLTLFAGPLNLKALNNPYERKKEVYRDSAIKLTKELPSEYPDFRFEQVESRCSEFAARAVVLWPSA